MEPLLTRKKKRQVVSLQHSRIKQMTRMHSIVSRCLGVLLTSPQLIHSYSMWTSYQNVSFNRSEKHCILTWACTVSWCLQAKEDIDIW